MSSACSEALSHLSGTFPDHPFRARSPSLRAWSRGLFGEPHYVLSGSVDSDAKRFLAQAELARRARSASPNT